MAKARRSTRASNLSKRVSNSSKGDSKNDPSSQVSSSSSNDNHSQVSDQAPSSKVEIISLAEPFYQTKQAFLQLNGSNNNNPVDYISPMALQQGGAVTVTAAATPKVCRHEYFGRIMIKNGGYEHTISLGDIIAFESTEHGVKEQPIRNVPWTVGQVVALFQVKISLHEMRYFANVQWLPRWKKQFLKNKVLTLTKEQQQELLKNFRPDQALVESQTLLTISLEDHVLPLHIKLESWKHFQGRDALKPELLHDASDPVANPDGRLLAFDVWTAFFNCVLTHRKHPLNALEDARDAWADYVQEPKNSHGDCKICQPPIVLQRAWNLLQHPELQEALHKYYQQFMLPPSSSKQTARLCRTEHPFTLFQSQWRIATQGVHNPPPRPVAETAPETSVVHKQNKTNKKRPPLPQAENKENTLEGANSNKKQRKGTVPAVTNKARPNSTITTQPPTDKKSRRVTFVDQPSLESSNRKKRKTEPEPSSQTFECVSAPRADIPTKMITNKDEVTTTLVHPEFLPQKAAVYILPKKKAKDKRDYYFFTSAVCSPAPQQHYQASFLKQNWQNHKQGIQLSSSWVVHIGDVIAVRMSDDISFTQANYPFRVPWGVGQVLSIFSVNDSAGSDNMQMEVRWFNSYEELDEKVQKNAPPHVKDGSCLVEMDEVVATLPVHSALGPIRVTTTFLKNFKATTTTRTDDAPALPVWTVSCRDLCQTETDEEHLYPLDHNDWPSLNAATDPTVWMVSDAPIRRGLYCPRTMAGKYRYKRLLKQYDLFLRKRLALLQEKEMNKLALQPWEPDHFQKATVTKNWSQTDLEPLTKIVHGNQDDVIVAQNKHRFYSALQLTILKERYDHRAIPKKSCGKSESTSFSVQVGEVVCLADNEAILSRDETKKSGGKNGNLFYPFKGPWSVYQILSLREAEDRKGNKSFCMEGRRLFRPCELPKQWHEFLPNHETIESTRKIPTIPILYESNLVMDNISASRILGHVDLSLGRAIVTQDITFPKHKTIQTLDEWITVPHQCRYFYLCGLSKLQPLYVADSCPKRWKKRFVERGLAFSEHISDNSSLREGVESRLGCQVSIGNCNQGFPSPHTRLGEQQDSTFDDLDLQYFDLLREGKAEESNLELAFPPRQDRGRTFYLSARVEPPWSKYALEWICHPNDRKESLWRVQVGDIVAIAGDSEAPGSQEEQCFPFKVSWNVCQVLSIYHKWSNKESTPDPSLCRVEVRFLHVPVSLKTESSVIPSVLETESRSATSIASVPITQLLGPVTAATSRDSVHTVWETMDPFLPACPFVFGGLHGGDFAGDIKYTSAGEMMASIIKRGVEMSEQYTELEKDRVLSKALAEFSGYTTNDEKSVSKISRASSDLSTLTVANVQGRPFHTDNATGTEYYDSINLKPPFDNYCHDFQRPLGSVTWTASLGNLVVLRCKHFLGRSSYGPMKGEDAKAIRQYPFNTPWGIAEIVNIFKPGFGSPFASPDEKDKDAVKIEVRWFYRLAELSGVVSSDCEYAGVGRLCEEILESDNYDVVSPSALLAPSYVYESPVDVTNEKKYIEMPVLEFFCRRFWSVDRRSLVPCGPLSGRIARGRLKSTIVTKDVLLAAELENMVEAKVEVPPDAVEPQREPNLTWKDHYAKVIMKLSLSDASKEGYEGQFALVGREKERRTIDSFLKGSILGTGKESASSMFIAGPPGTGKTASVLAAIKEIKRNSGVQGSVDFNFVYLNGMEMRHPFEAYARLWEKISGTSQVSPDVAAQQLEHFFTHDDPRQKKQVVVVLLDEIDYLVTKSQTVLYNFFDWPLRTKQRKLVLLGISNTLNLPEQLHNRVSSRIGNRRCMFKAYDSDQITAILRLKVNLASPDFPVFDNDALVFASKKTASQSGDLRKAFQMCRAAAEYVMNEHGNEAFGKAPIVTIKDVLKVSRETFHSAQSKAVGFCSPFEVLLLVTLAALCRNTGRAVGGFDCEEIVTKMEGIANSLGEEMYCPPPSLGETLDLLLRLGEAHLVSLCSPKSSSVSFRASLAGSGGPWPLVSLLVEDAAVFSALKQTQHKSLVEKHLGRT